MARVRSIVVRSYEAYNARDFDAYRELLDDDVEFVLAGVTVRGRVAVTDFVAVTARARPSLRIAPQRFLAETDNTLVAEIRMIDTIGVGSVEEASTVETEACCVYRVTGDRLKEVRVYLDPGGEEEEVARMAVAAEQSALRRVAELVAQQAPSEQVFTLVTDELSRLLGVNLVRTVRFESDGSVTVLASRGSAEDALGPGTNVPLPSGTVIDQVFRTGQPARVEDYTQVKGPVGDVLRKEGARSGAGGPVVVDGRLWGAMAVGSTARTLAPGTEDRVTRFAELVSTAISNIESRARVERLAAEQSALRRVAELVARQAPPEQLFTLVTDELSHLLRVPLMVGTIRFEPDGSATILAARGTAADRMPPGTNIPLVAGGVLDEVLRTGRPARLDDYAHVQGRNEPELFERLRKNGLRCGAGGPIVVEGRIWGAMLTASKTPDTLPPGVEDRIAQFAELVSTAISNVESRARVERLAAEQAALRRVAELVAQQAPPEQVFALVTEELNQLVGDGTVSTARFEPDGTATIMATRGAAKHTFPPGRNVPIAGGSTIDQVFRTGRAAHVEDYREIGGEIGPSLRHLGLRWGAAGPIVVDGRLWGTMAIASTSETMPPGTEERVARFAELVSTAISNVESRAKVEWLAAEQAALRRVAEFVAAQPPPTEVFALVTEELSRLLEVSVVRTLRFEPDGTATILAASAAENAEHGPYSKQAPPGTNFPPPSGGVVDQVFLTGRPARIDDYAQVGSPADAALRQEGLHCAAGGPIVVDGLLWGAMVVASETANAMPAGTEDRVARFAELVSTAISNVESRAKVERLAAEKAALSRVAERIAAQPPPEHVFALVTQELSRLLGVDMVRTVRFEADGSATVVASSGMADDPIPPGTNAPIPSGSVIDKVSRTSQPARVDDYAKVGGSIAARLTEQGAGSAAGGPIVVDGRLWGAMVACKAAEPLPSDTEERVAQFAELVSTAISNVESRTKVERLATEQAALRRVATLVAEGAMPNRVFDTVRDEVEQMFGIPNTILMRFDPDGMATLLATPGQYLGPVGKQWPLEGDDSAVTRVYRTGRAARADYTAGAIGPLAEAARLGGTLFPVAVPVVVDGALWGAMSVGSRGPQPPPDLEGRLAKFTELLATAIANAENRAELAASEARARLLASEQAALRRVATLVARGASPDELFSAVTEEIGVLLDVDAASILRYETDSTVTVVTGWSNGTIQLPLGARLPLEGENLAAEVLRTGKPQRKDEYGHAPGRIASTVRELGLDSAVASPIVVEGAIWGVIGVLSRKPKSLPADAEARLAEFSQVAGIAIANAKSRSDLAESRARIVRAGDEARRRFERDLHDGAQQRLVSLGLELRAAEATIPPELHDLRPRLSGLRAGLTDVLDDLRELSSGLHPAVLSEDGLSPALQSLALRSAVPVDLHIDLDSDRFEAPVEVAAYYVASEALTNIAKHAKASRAQVRVSRNEAWLELTVRDDGSGGADPSTGTGLTGLADRVEAIGGTIRIESPPDAGTAIYVSLPTGSTR